MPPVLYSPRHPLVAAVLVVFDVRADASQALQRLLGYVNEVVLVDNAPGGHPHTERWQVLEGVTVIVNGNRGGLAGAYNVAVAYLSCSEREFEHVVFVDEDSDPSVLDDLLSDPALSSLLTDPSVAAVAPAHRDRATGMRARHMKLSRWKICLIDREIRGLQRVTFIINSMSVWRMQALLALGPFDETLAVDHVDTDYCLRALARGLAIYLAADHEFNHAIGARRSYKLFGMAVQSSGHAPGRRHSIGRNTARLGLRYSKRWPAFLLLAMMRLLLESLGILFAEDQKCAKLTALWKGVVDGVQAHRVSIP